MMDQLVCYQETATQGAINIPPPEVKDPPPPHRF